MRLAGLRHLYDHPGPWASVYLDASRALPNAAPTIELRWQGLRDRLADHGAEPTTLAALDRALAAAPAVVGRGGLALFAAGDEAAPAEELPEPPVADRVELSPLPRVRELVAARDPVVRWVRAAVDRTGADVSTVDSGWAGVTGSATYPMTKNAPGGWSQARYQRSAQNSWDRNAIEIAQAVAEAADRVSADVIVLAGDVRARQLIIERLPGHLADLVVHTNGGGRAGGTDPATLDEETAEAVRDTAGRRRTEMVDRFLVDLAHGNAVAGLDRVLDAARQRRIAVLLLTGDGGVGDGTLWLDPRHPELLGTTRGAARDLGAAEPVEEDRDTALLAAVALADGEAVTLPGDVTVPSADGRNRGGASIPDGVGAILR